MHSLVPVPLMCIEDCTLVSKMKKDHCCSKLFMINSSALGFLQEHKKIYLHVGKYLLSFDYFITKLCCWLVEDNFFLKLLRQLNMNVSSPGLLYFRFCLIKCKLPHVSVNFPIRAELRLCSRGDFTELFSFFLRYDM